MAKRLKSYLPLNEIAVSVRCVSSTPVVQNAIVSDLLLCTQTKEDAEKQKNRRQ